MLVLSRKKNESIVINNDVTVTVVEIRGDETILKLASGPKVIPATEADWTTEYLDLILAVRVVDGLEGAMAHVARATVPDARRGGIPNMIPLTVDKY